MRPKKPKATGEGDLFRARLDQIINMKHELVQLAGKIDWDWLDGVRCESKSDLGARRRPVTEPLCALFYLLSHDLHDYK